MSADIIPFPNCGQPSRQPASVKIHCETDGSFVVRISPCPERVIGRRKFFVKSEAFSHADNLARRHSVTHVNGNASWSVTWAGPEASA